MEGDGDEEALGDFFVVEGADFVQVEEGGEGSEDGPAGLVVIFVHYRAGEGGEAVVVAEDAGEHDVGESGEEGAEDKGQEDAVGAADLHDVVEIDHVFGEGKAEGNDDEIFDAVGDGVDLFVVDDADGGEFGDFFDDADDHEGG